ncbi:TonB-dependent receptor plug domain-containing protein [Candidatus Rariloculus sp.]|uniref:TonB-dependent receptor plug domain-containing protein n=1 Tax=Candidatus Rariloculus sp. TaxID=3101265 RepID=UPI003D0C1EF1
MTYRKAKQVPSGPANLTVLASAISAVLGTVAVSPAAGQEVLEEVTVTGSRIVRRDLTSASPILSIETAQFEQSSTLAVESVLNAMPHFVPETTQFTTGQTEPSGFVTPGVASVNLRGLGPNRNLVLLDGRRAQPANALLIVDVNTIPSAAIERVETITGGASAVYGPDALAGVVNFILKEDFEGVEMDLQSGQSAQGDGTETKFSSVIGMNAADDRGNVMLGVEWTRRDEVRWRDRDWRAARWFDPNTESGGFLHTPGYRARRNPPSQEAVDALFRSYDPNYVDGTVPSNSEFYFNPDGSIFMLGGRGVPGGYNYNGPLNKTEIDGMGYTGVRFAPDGTLQQNQFERNISAPMERRSAFGRAVYDMTDSVSAFVQANYSAVDVEQVSNYVPAITVWQAYVPVDGREVPADLATLLASRDNPDQAWTVFRGLDFMGPEKARNQSDVYQILAGVEGSIDAIDGSWEAYVSTGRTSNWYLGANNGSLQRYQSIVAVGDWGRAGRNNVLNQPTSPRTVRSSSYAQTCESGVPIFAAQGIVPGPISPDCHEAIESKMKQLTQITQDIATFNLEGSAGENWAGEMRFAVGATQRKNDFLFQPSEVNDDVNTEVQVMGLFASNQVQGDQTMTEIYGEYLLPLAENLELELGLRFSDSDITGSAETWKALFSWTATDTVRLRGGFQFATRSPNVSELYTGPAVDVVSFPPSDPCAYTTLAPWGNREDNPRRLEVQSLCRAIIGNTTSDFDTGPGGPNNHARPGSPFFPLEIEIIQGNDDLNPEEAETLTLGVVLNGPGNLDNLVASIDYYNIEIAGAISPLDSVFVYQQCFNGTSTGNDGTSNPDLTINDPGGWCALITRGETSGLRSRVQAPFFNSGILETSGIDVSVNWGTDMGPGNLNINTVATYVDRFESQDNPAAPVFDTIGTMENGGQFKYRIVSTFSYAFADASIGVQWRHFPSIKDETAARDPTTRILPVDSYDLLNLFARYRINDRMELRGGIDNLIDDDPPIVGWDPGIPARGVQPNHNVGNTEEGFYDPLGRRYYVGFKMSF